MTRPSFVDLLTSPPVPWWLRGYYGSRFLGTLGATLDDIVASLYAGKRAAMPMHCEADALPAIGRDRKLRWYPTEPEASYRYRLSRWRQIRKAFGSDYGVLINLQPYFLPGPLPRLRLVAASGDGASATWSTLNPDGTFERHVSAPANWNYDGQIGKWARSFLVIEWVPGIFGQDPHAWDDGTVYDDDTTLWGGVFTAAERDDMVAIVKEAMALHCRFEAAFVTLAPGDLAPTGSVSVNADGSTTYPIGNWATMADPVTGLPTMPETVVKIWDANW